MMQLFRPEYKKIFVIYHYLRYFIYKIICRFIVDIAISSIKIKMNAAEGKQRTATNELKIR